VHRDIKPDNVYGRGEERPRPLMDFGIANCLDPAVAKGVSRVTICRAWRRRHTGRRPSRLRLGRRAVRGLMYCTVRPLSGGPSWRRPASHRGVEQFARPKIQEQDAAALARPLTLSGLDSRCTSPCVWACGQGPGRSRARRWRQRFDARVRGRGAAGAPRSIRLPQTGIT